MGSAGQRHGRGGERPQHIDDDNDQRNRPQGGQLPNADHGHGGQPSVHRTAVADLVDRTGALSIGTSRTDNGLLRASRPIEIEPAQPPYTEETLLGTTESPSPRRSYGT